MEFLATGQFWVLVALLIFIGILIYMKVPGMLAAQLDKRSTEIADELEQARRLREEAQQLLARRRFGIRPHAHAYPLKGDDKPARPLTRVQHRQSLNAAFQGLFPGVPSPT